MNDLSFVIFTVSECGGRLVFKGTSCLRNCKFCYNLAQINSEIDYQFEIAMLELMRQHVMSLL